MQTDIRLGGLCHTGHCSSFTASGTIPSATRAVSMCPVCGFNLPVEMQIAVHITSALWPAGHATASMLAQPWCSGKFKQ